MFYTDSDLSPYTTYSYQLITSNIRSNTSSAAVSLRTLSAVPEDLQLTLTGRARPTGASFNWTEPQNTTGPVESYTLSSIRDLTGEERIHYTGLQTEASAEELHPFTRYNFSLQACTSGGCSRSESLVVLTAQIPPQQQPAPKITTLGPTQLKVDWEAPALPNGIYTGNLLGLFYYFGLTFGIYCTKHRVSSIRVSIPGSRDIVLHLYYLV